MRQFFDFTWVVYEDLRFLCSIDPGSIDCPVSGVVEGMTGLYTKDRLFSESWTVKHTYYPLKQTGLHRVFAEVDSHSLDQMIAFVNRWGPLTLEGLYDSMELWKSEIALMNYCVCLHDTLKSGATSELQELVAQADHFFSLSTATWPAQLVPTEPRKVRGAEQIEALSLASNIVSNRLSAGQYPVQARIIPGDSPHEDHQMNLVLEPSNLIGALWLQVAQAFTGDKIYRPCKVCGLPFEISLSETGYRKNRIYCSDACRQKAYRQRKA